MNAALKVTKNKALRVAWIAQPTHGILIIEITHSRKEKELYRLQQMPREYYVKLLRVKDPETLTNQLLKMWLPPEPVASQPEIYFGEY